MTDRPELAALIARASWPDRIYLQTGGIDMADYTDCEVTWCVDEIEDNDVGYIRADLLHAAEAERDAIRDASLGVLQDAEALERELSATKAERDSLRERAERAETEVARLRHEITEASNPDFLWVPLAKVVDEDTTISDFATAASRAIRAAVFRSGVADVEDDDND